MGKIIAVIIGAVFLTGCQQPTAPAAGTTSSTPKAALTVTANTSGLGISSSPASASSGSASSVAASIASKTLLPSGISFNPGAVTYTLTIAGTSLGYSYNSSNTTGSFSIATLADGTYFYSLTAASGGVTVGTYSSSFTVAGQAVALNPTLVIPSGSGSFSLSLSWPASYNYTAVVTLTPNGGSASNLAVTTATASSLTTITFPSTSYPTGNYTLNVSLTQSGGSMASWGLQESVYIYAGQTTALSKALTTSDLNAPLADGGAPTVTWGQAFTDVITNGIYSFYPVLTWGTVTGATGYMVQRSNDNSHWTDLTTAPITALIYKDTAGNSIPNYYRVVARNLFGTTAQTSVQAVLTNTWYVAVGGTGSGMSASNPTGNFQYAVDAAAVAALVNGTAATVKVAASGTAFVPSSYPSFTSAQVTTAAGATAWMHFALRSHVTVICGYDSSFSSVTGTNTFSGNSHTRYHVFYNCGSLNSAELDNAVISFGGLSNGSSSIINDGGGMLIGESFTDSSLSGFSYNTWSGSVTLKSCLFTDNFSSMGGGGLRILGADVPSNQLTLEKTRFTNNTCSDGSGGALWVSAASALNPVTVSITGNGLTSGGSASDFYHNSNGSTVYGGGGVMLENSSTTLTDVSFDSNTSSSIGGALANYRTVGMSNPISFKGTCVFTGNSASTCGGAIALMGKSTAYCPISCDSSATLKFTGNQVTSTSGDSYGGALYLAYTSGSLTNATFDGNQTIHGNNNGVYRLGGSVYMYSAATSFSQCIFKNGFAGYGGALYIKETGSTPVVFNSCNFNSNSAISITNAYGNGGAIITDNAVINCTNCVFNDNLATEGGGAVFLTCSSPVPSIFNRCIFSNNTAQSHGTNPCGGAVKVKSNSGCGPVFTFCLMHDNTDGDNGNALYSDLPVALVRCTILKNGLADGASVVVAANSLGLFSIITGAADPFYFVSWATSESLTEVNALISNSINGFPAAAYDSDFKLNAGPGNGVAYPGSSVRTFQVGANSTQNYQYSSLGINGSSNSAFYFYCNYLGCNSIPHNWYSSSLSASYQWSVYNYSDGSNQMFTQDLAGNPIAADTVINWGCYQ